MAVEVETLNTSGVSSDELSPTSSSSSRATPNSGLSPETSTPSLPGGFPAAGVLGSNPLTGVSPVSPPAAPTPHPIQPTSAMPPSTETPTIHPPSSSSGAPNALQTIQNYVDLRLSVLVQQEVNLRCDQLAEQIGARIASIENQVLLSPADEPMSSDCEPNDGDGDDEDDEDNGRGAQNATRHAGNRRYGGQRGGSIDDEDEDNEDDESGESPRRSRGPVVLTVCGLLFLALLVLTDSQHAL